MNGTPALQILECRRCPNSSLLTKATLIST